MPRFPEVAESAIGLSDEVFSKLAARARARSGKTFALHVGDTYLDPCEGARAEAFRASEHPRLHNYAPVQGEPRLLDAIERHVARRSGVTLERGLVQVVSGATAGISVVVDALLAPGDELLLLAPFWPLVRGTASRRGARAVEVPFWDRLATLVDRPAIEAYLESFVTPRTSALYLNTPHNPTGDVIGAAQLDAIAAVAERNGLWVITDEVYEELYFDEPPRSAWAHPRLRARSVAVYSVSKAYALAGARVGFVHGPEEAMAAIRGVQTFLTYCAPKPMQLAAAHALDAGEAWIAEARASYRRLAERAADAIGVARPAGGTFLFFDTRPHRRGGESAIGFLERLLDHGILLTPGSASGRDYADWARLCFTTLPPEELDEALAILRRVLADR